MPATTPVLALPYPVAADTADVPRDIQALAVKLDGYTSLRPPVVTSLPGSPVDGQECYFLADATNGVVWHLRYRSAAAGSYKWELVGGSPLLAEIATNENVTINAGYIDLATVGPQLTNPLAGDYLVTGYASLFTVNLVTFAAFAAPKFGAAAVVDPGDRLAFYGGTGVTTGSGAITGRTIRRTLAASTLVKLQYSAVNATVQANNRSLALLPVRVG